MSIEDILRIEFLAMSKEIVKAYDEKGMRASGKFAKELEVRTTEYSAELLSVPYAQQLELGRRAGGFPPLKMIEDWIRAKGVFNDALKKIKISSLAYLIARKISREGWNREKHGGVNLLSEIVTDERIQSIIDKVGDVSLTFYTTEIIGLLNEMEHTT
jgi:hypothetical protein